PPGIIRGIRRGGGWLQDHLRPAPQALRHALDHSRCQRHHRAPMLSTERALGSVLGVPCHWLISPTHKFVARPSRDHFLTIEALLPNNGESSLSGTLSAISGSHCQTEPSERWHSNRDIVRK